MGEGGGQARPRFLGYLPFHACARLQDSAPQAEDRHAAILGKLMLAASKVAKAAGVAEGGYRVVVNAGEHGCEGRGSALG